MMQVVRLTGKKASRKSGSTSIRMKPVCQPPSPKVGNHPPLPWKPRSSLDCLQGGGGSKVTFQIQGGVKYTLPQIQGGGSGRLDPPDTITRCQGRSLNPPEGPNQGARGGVWTP
eukprot:1186741-Prorocentrum_minimum.AAC.2